MRTARGILRVALACLLFAAVSPAPACAAEAPIVAPLELLKTRHIVVSVRVNDAGPFRLVLDTGSPVTLLSSRAAEKSGLITAATSKQPTMLGMHGQVAAKVVEVGGVQVRGLNVLVLDHPVIDLLSQIEGPIDGIVGFSFLSRFHTTLDYAAGQVSFQPVDYKPQDVLSSLFSRMMNPQPTRTVVAPSALWGIAVDRPSDAEEAAGVRVTRVYPRSAAEAAGLRAGDWITTIAGRWTDTVRDCYEAAAAVPPGRSVTVKVLRDGEELVLTVRPRLGI